MICFVLHAWKGVPCFLCYASNLLLNFTSSKKRLFCQMILVNNIYNSPWRWLWFLVLSSDKYYHSVCQITIPNERQRFLIMEAFQEEEKFPTWGQFYTHTHIPYLYLIFSHIQTYILRNPYFSCLGEFISIVFLNCCSPLCYRLQLSKQILRPVKFAL